MPTPSADQSHPSWIGPTASTSFANTGSKNTNALMPTLQRGSQHQQQDGLLFDEHKPEFREQIRGNTLSPAFAAKIGLKCFLGPYGHQAEG